MTVLKTRSLTKDYQEKSFSLDDGKLALSNHKALDGVDLELEAGHIYGLVGNNGAGKTTLMRVIAGLVNPTSGTFSLYGSDSKDELFSARQRVGSLIAQPAGYESLSLWQNLVSQANLMPAVSQQEITDLCDLVGLEQIIRNRSLQKASTGEKQRYGLASALMGRPDFLLLDEPMNGLDPSGIVEIRELLLRLHEEHSLTILISSHLLTELHQVATDYIFLHKGKVVETITAKELDARIEERGLGSVEDYFLALEGLK